MATGGSSWWRSTMILTFFFPLHHKVIIYQFFFLVWSKPDCNFVLKKRFLENFILSIFLFLGKRPRRFFFQLQIFNFLVRSILAKGFRFNESHSSKNRRRQYSRVCVWHTIKRDPDFATHLGCLSAVCVWCGGIYYIVKERVKKPTNKFKKSRICSFVTRREKQEE